MSASSKDVKRQFTDADFDLLRGIVDAINRHGSFTHDFGSIGNGATADATIDVSGHNAQTLLAAGDDILVTMEDDLNDGLVIVSAEVTGEDQLRITLFNASSGSIDPGAITFFWFAPLTLNVL